MIGVVVVIMVGSFIAAYLLTPPRTSTHHAPPEPDASSVPTIVHDEESPDLVIPAGPVTRIELPAIGPNGFDSNTLISESVPQPITEWTAARDKANHFTLEPGLPANSSIVWDSTVPGGGLVGTNVQTSALFAGHVTPWKKDISELGVFQYLLDSKLGDPAAISNEHGRMCFTLIEYDVIDKGESVQEKYRTAPPVEGVIYIAACYRVRGDNIGPTEQNLVLSFQLNQDKTNTGSCW